MTARVFHTETMGAVDGPGLRLVLFLQGCPLRCPYCHNPEGWAIQGGDEITTDHVLSLLQRNRAYYKRGGLTISGGEPLLHAPFLIDLFARCRALGIHTTLDTSGCIVGPDALAASAACDLLLLDIKHADPALNETMFGFPLAHTLEHLRARQALARPVWLRQVVLPAATDAPAYMARLAALAAPFSCIEKTELLPFRKLCLEKYEHRGLVFPAAYLPEVTAQDVAALGGEVVGHCPTPRKGHDAP